MIRGKWLRLRSADLDTAMCQALWLIIAVLLMHVGFLVFRHDDLSEFMSTLPKNNSVTYDLLGLGISITLLLLAVFITLGGSEATGRIWVLGVPFAGVVAIGVVNFLSHDSSPGAQALLILPVIFAASHLSPCGASLLTLMAVLAEWISMWHGSGHQYDDARYISISRQGWSVAVTLYASLFVLPCFTNLQKRFMEKWFGRAPWRIPFEGTALLLIRIDPNSSIQLTNEFYRLIRSQCRVGDHVDHLINKVFILRSMNCSEDGAYQIAGRLYASFDDHFRMQEAKADYVIQVIHRKKKSTFVKLLRRKPGRQYGRYSHK